jgi:hypothetical protein
MRLKAQRRPSARLFTMPAVIRLSRVARSADPSRTITGVRSSGASSRAAAGYPRSVIL